MSSCASCCATRCNGRGRERVQVLPWALRAAARPPVLAVARGTGRARRADRADVPRLRAGGRALLLGWLLVQGSRGEGSPVLPLPWLLVLAGTRRARLRVPPGIAALAGDRAAIPGGTLRQASEGAGVGPRCLPLSSPGGPRTPGLVGSLSYYFKIGSRSTLEKMGRRVLLSLTGVQARCILASSEWPSDTIHGIHAGREPRARMDISGGRRAISPASYIARCPRCARGQHPGDALGRCRAGVVSRCN